MSKLGRGGISKSAGAIPGPGTYDKESFKATLPRVQFGKLLKGQKCKSMSFKGSGLSPGQYTVKHVDPHMGAPAFKLSSQVTKSAPLAKKDFPDSCTYNPSTSQTLDREPHWGMSKAEMPRFTEAAAKSKKNIPPPGNYKVLPVDVQTRGTKWSQLHGVGRSSLHGTF
jgi:hypothetical protein